MHHVFPKRGRPAPADPERLDSICNIAPISEFTNRWIGKRPPEEYLAAILDRGVPRARLEQILARHLIPIELMHPKRLDDFYAHRRAAILGLAHAALRDRGTHPVLDLCRGRRVLGRRRGRSAF